MNPILSIIIPTLNSADNIGRAVDSVLGQSFSAWEMLIMDGGSFDDTIEIVFGYKDSRIKVFKEKDSGIYDAMNKGVRKAKGTWLYFLGSDDYLLEKDALEQMLRDTDDCDMVYGEVQSTHLAPIHKGEWSNETLLYNRCHQAIIYRHSVFDQIGGYPLKYPVCADHYINLRIFLSSQCHVQYRPIVVAYHSAGGFSSTSEDYTFYNDIDWLIIRYGVHRLPAPLLMQYCQNALKHHRTIIQRILLMVFQIWLKISIKWSPS